MPCPTTTRTEILRHARDFVGCWDAIQSLRRELNVEDDVLLNPLHFLATTDGSRQSCSVACWRGERLIGLVYATEHYAGGLRTGYAVGGDFVGRGLLLCRPEHEAEVVGLAVDRLTSSGVHALHLRMIPVGEAPEFRNGFALRCLDAVVPGDRMALRPTFDEWLATLGKHTRRNIRYYTRKATAAGIEFVPSLTRDEYHAGVARLNARTAFQVQPLRIARDERLLGLHGGGLRCGLRAKDGSLVSVLCGFSQGGRFHLLTQLNDVHLEHLSLSPVLRGYTVEQLIRSGHTSLQFMGGASLSFSRFCVPQAYRSIFVDKRQGLTAAVKFLASRGVHVVEGLGRPVPDLMKSLANGYLDHAGLVSRTVLAPAAIIAQGALSKEAKAAQAEPAASPFSKPFPRQPVPAAATQASLWAAQQAFARTPALDRPPR